MENQATKVQKQENPIASLLINLIIPYFILTKGAKFLGENGSTWALLIAVSLPTIYGARDYFQNDRTNYISVFGVLNTLFTGGFALLKLGSTWFIVKEAAFPFVLGVLVFISSLTKKPVVKFLFNFAHIMDLELIQQKLQENHKQGEYDQLLLKTNTLFSVSFFLSALLNFALAYWVFRDIDPGLSESEKAAVLNQQIAEMWWMGYVVIAAPLTVFLMAVLFKLVKGIEKLTGLEMEQIFPSMNK